MSLIEQAPVPGIYEIDHPAGRLPAHLLYCSLDPSTLLTIVSYHVLGAARVRSVTLKEWTERRPVHAGDIAAEQCALVPRNDRTL